MKKIGVFLLLAGLFLIFSTISQPTNAQTVTTGTVIGTVTDPSGAAVTDATVVLRNKATNGQATQKTNSAGQYTFANVTPGEYEVMVKKDGFRTADVESLTVEVSKSYNVDVRLEIGAASESVTVTTEARVELQTTDAQLGDVVGGTTLGRLPTLQRDAAELLTLQPGTTPYDTPGNGGFGNQGGTVAGARSDQNTIVMDGIDITDNTVGGGANAQNFIPTGVESLEEFRVGVTNSNATFSRASGGQITLISKGGGNTFHGDGYWFHQSDGLNANSWDLNHTKDLAKGTPFTRKSPFKDNREGVSVGGPVFKNKTFFFSNYEKRRFPAGQTVTHIVPTDSLRSGILQFQDCSQGFDPQGNCKGGTLRQYNLAAAMNCGPNGNLACDPRGIGISPTLQALYKLNPEGTDPSVTGADGNNTLGLRTSVTTPIKQDYVTFRLDHNFTDKMHFFGRYLYSRNLQVTSNQISALAGKPTVADTGNFTRGDGVIGALDYAFNSTTNNVIRYGWIRSRIFLPGLSPSASAATLALPGTDSSGGPVALAPGLGTVGLLDVPIDVDTQRARTQGNFQRTKQLIDDFSKIKGKHNIVTGGSIRWLPIIAQRNDKVVGSLASLVALMDADGNGGASTIPAVNRPPNCGGAVTTFCLLNSTDATKWDRLYAATLGIVDNINVLAVRDGNLNPQPFGTPLIAKANMQAYDMYVQDTWRFKPTLTLTYGLSYGWQTPPHEAHNEQTFIVNASNNQILSGQAYINSKLQAALQGQAFNPNIGYLPIAKSGRNNIYNPDYGDVGPRASLAWSPSYADGFLGHMMGSGKTVVRAGFGIYYDRINNVQSVEIPQLGVGFAQTLVLKSPLCNVNASSAKCNAAAGGNDIGGSGFRVGVDGSIPVPGFPTVKSPVVPANPFGEVLSFSLDPSFKVGRSYSFDFTIQRELPGNMLMEVGYIGRLGRDLPNSFDFDSAPYMLKDPASGQTFAQAFNAITAQLDANPNNPVTAQPWFENQLPGFGASAKSDGFAQGCATAGLSTTQCLVNQNQSLFQSRFVSTRFQNMGFDRRLLGMTPYNNLQVVLALFVRSHTDLSNYHAATFTLRKRPSHGLQFDLNYTFSKSLDQLGGVQNNAGTFATSFNPNLQYGPSLFDRKHVFNGIFNYDLPAGKGHKVSFSNGVLDKVISGWYVTGVFRANSGLPLPVVGGDFGGGPFANSVNMLPTVDPGSLGGGAHHGVTGTTFGSGGSTNIFTNPDKAAADFRYPNIGVDGRDGSGHPLRGLGLWNLDSRLGKTTSFHERYKVEISADFFNLFNHVNFFDPSLNINSQATFGVISSELVPANRTQGSRWIELGLRLSF
jgi:hypothetical protein